jgi:hypothetical protein
MLHEIRAGLVLVPLKSPKPTVAISRDCAD